jgi:hypothetical protein
VTEAVFTIEDKVKLKMLIEEFSKLCLRIRGIRGNFECFNLKSGVFCAHTKIS